MRDIANDLVIDSCHKHQDKQRSEDEPFLGFLPVAFAGAFLREGSTGDEEQCVEKVLTVGRADERHQLFPEVKVGREEKTLQDASSGNNKI
jgi:hypothetical protein